MKNIFSVDSTLWENVDTFISWLGRQQYHHNVSNGECFLRAIQICLQEDYGKDTDPEQLKTLIMSEVHRKAEKFKDFHDGDAMKVIVSAFEYLKYRVFTSNIVDIVIPCTADALKINLFIYT